MNIFYEEFPDYIEVNGEKYKVLTDFREWIRFSDMLKADIPISMKIQFTSEMFLDNVPNIESEEIFNATMEGIVNFISMNDLKIRKEEESSSSEPRRKGVYYDYDAPLIISAFLQDYHIDLIDIPYLHWWKFKMLLDGLDEKRQIKERIYYRTVDLNSIKDKKEREHIIRIRRRIAIMDDEYVSDEEIGNAFV